MTILLIKVNPIIILKMLDPITIPMKRLFPFVYIEKYALVTYRITYTYEIS